MKSCWRWWQHPHRAEVFTCLADHLDQTQLPVRSVTDFSAYIYVSFRISASISIHELCLGLEYIWRDLLNDKQEILEVAVSLSLPLFFPLTSASLLCGHFHLSGNATHKYTNLYKFGTNLIKSGSYWAKNKWNFKENPAMEQSVNKTPKVCTSVVPSVWVMSYGSLSTVQS